MMRGAAWVLAVLLMPGVGCGQSLSVRVTADVESVPFGAAVPLTVERRYSAGLDPEGFSAAAFAPLAARTLSSERRVEGDETVELVRVETWAFANEKLTIPAIAFRAAMPDGSEELAASSEPVEVAVTSILPPDDAGDAELPGDLLELPMRWTAWLLPFTALAAVLLLGSFVIVRWRRAVPAVVRQNAREVALAKLTSLEDLAADADIQATQGWYLALSDIVRDYVEDAFAVEVPGMTSEQFLASEVVAGALGGAHESLSDFLFHCDGVKFGRFPTTSEQRVEARVLARSFIAGEFTPTGDGS